MAQLMVVLDTTVADIAVPCIAHYLNMGAHNISGIITAHALAFGGFLLLGGRLGDLYGRRLLFLVGVRMFATPKLRVSSQ